MAGSIKKSLLNLESSSNEFASFTTKMNNGNGALSKLVTDQKMGKMVDSTMKNIQETTKGFTEITEAAKHNFLLRGYFKKKEKAEDKKQEELDSQEEAELKKAMKVAEDSAAAVKK
jgi:phospholipid/cholesterol/gamma-HCH transport system substrate-binding protein